MSVKSTIENQFNILLSSLEKDVVSDYTKQISDIISIITEIQSSGVNRDCKMSESDISNFLASLNTSQFDFFSKFAKQYENSKLLLKAQKMHIALLQKYIEDDEILSNYQSMISDKYHELDVEIVSHEKLLQKDQDDKSNKARFAALKKHEPKNKAKNQIREIWATGKYSSRDICAEQECASLGLSYSTARKALINH